jgi:coenzyme PQQ precursor peptide PqqA
MNNWDKPSFVEIDMSAEIGGYQGDDPDRPTGPDDMPEFVQRTEPALERS